MAVSRRSDIGLFHPRPVFSLNTPRVYRQFGHVKTRYRGLAKNRAQLFTLFALGNLFLMRRKLAA